MRNYSSNLCIILLALVCGCGATVQSNFPNALTDPEGQPILFDDVNTILSNTGLTDDEKKDALRDLGIEDEDLIQALVDA